MEITFYLWNKNLKRILKILMMFSLLGLIVGCNTPQKEQQNYKPREIVLSDGMKICAKTNTDSICISAIGGTKRSILWDGKVNSIPLIPREKRWHGNLGLISPKQPKNLWKSQNGIIRVLIQETQIRFDNIHSALEAINFPGRENGYNVVYNDDGVLIQWHTSNLPDQRVLDLMVFQMLIDGKKPNKIPGSQNINITVSY